MGKKATFTMKLDSINVEQMRTAFASEAEASKLSDGEWWMPEPSLTRAWFKGIGLHSFPKANDNGQAITYATLSKSQYSCTSQQVNIEHGLKANSVNPNGSPIVVGAIREMWVPWLEDGEDEIIPSAPVPAYIMAAIWRKQGKEILEDFKKPNLGGWKLSMECLCTYWEYYWKGQFWTPIEKPEFANAVNTVVDGDLVVEILGGRNGQVEFQGFALTQNPADTGATILQAVATNRGKEAVYKDGIVLLDFSSEEATSNDKEDGGMNMDEKTLALIENAKKTAVEEAKKLWDQEQATKIKEAVAAKQTELDTEIASLKQKIETLTSEKEAIAKENETFKLEKRTAQRLEALASVTIPENIKARVNEKAQTLDDEAWGKEVEDIKAWAAIASVQPSAKTPVVPVVPTDQTPKENTASIDGAKVKVGDKEYSFDDLFATAVQK